MVTSSSFSRLELVRSLCLLVLFVGSGCVSTRRAEPVLGEAALAPFVYLLPLDMPYTGFVFQRLPGTIILRHDEGQAGVIKFSCREEFLGMLDVEDDNGLIRISLPEGFDIHDTEYASVKIELFVPHGIALGVGEAHFVDAQVDLSSVQLSLQNRSVVLLKSVEHIMCFAEGGSRVEVMRLSELGRLSAKGSSITLHAENARTVMIEARGSSFIRVDGSLREPPQVTIEGSGAVRLGRHLVPDRI